MREGARSGREGARGTSVNGRDEAKGRVRGEQEVRSGERRAEGGWPHPEIECEECGTSDEEKGESSSVDAMVAELLLVMSVRCGGKKQRGSAWVSDDAQSSGDT